MAGELAGYLYQNSLSRAQGERGNCGYDHRQIFTTTMVARAPGWAVEAAKAVTKDWQLSPILNIFTGNPIQPFRWRQGHLPERPGLDRPEVIAPTQVYTVPAGDPSYWFQSRRIPVRGIQRHMHPVQRPVWQPRPKRRVRSGPDQFRPRLDQTVSRWASVGRSISAPTSSTS